MAVDGERARAMALALAGASEVVHFDRAGFRTKRKMFATLGAGGADLNLMFTPALRDFYCEVAPGAFAPVAGGWGRMGATRCDLGVVDEATLASALAAAHGLAVEARKRSFLKQRTKKLCSLTGDHRFRRDSGVRSFLVLFCKKELLAFREG